MAGVDGRPLWLRQMAAVAQLQWRLVGRTGVRGVEAKRKLTVISMAFSVLFSAGLGTLLATLTYRGLAAGSLGLISVLLWFTLPAWQFLALQRPAASGYRSSTILPS